MDTRSSHEGAEPRRAPWPLDDENLAEAIGIDARRRIASGDRLSLREYLDAIPHLARSPVALDIAIESVLLSHTRGRMDRESLLRASQELSEAHPELAPAIRDAAALSALMCSTRTMKQRALADLLPTPPTDFGPRLPGREARFRLVGLLGMGAHGAVYLAIDRALSEPDRPAQVAIKVLLTEESESQDSAVITSEGAKARRIDHPNVVRIYDAGVADDGLSYLVSEYVPGGTLRKGDRAVQTPMPARDAARLCAQIADGVQAAHAAGLIHFDLKPDNILLGADGAPKVADFSLAVRSAERLLKSDGADPTPGTIGFMAPEQLRGETARLDARADIYALGGILYWLLTGGFPNSAGLENRRGYDPGASHRRQRECLAHLPTDLRAIVLRALSPDPEARHRTAAQFADDLRLWIEKRPIPWTRPSTGRVATMWVRRRPIVAGVALAALLGAGAAAGTVARLNALARAADAEAKAKAFDAQIAQARLEEEERWKTEARKTISVLQGQWRHIMREGVATENLTVLWAQESLFGGGLITDNAMVDATRRQRAELYRVAFAEVVRTQGVDSVEALVLGSSAVYSDLFVGNTYAASQVFDEFAPHWRDRLTEDDRWRTILRVLEECIGAQRASLNGAPLPSDDHFASLVNEVRGMTDASPMRLLIRETNKIVRERERVEPSLSASGS